jgi:hypothetical protein
MREDLTERQTNAGLDLLAVVALWYARMPCLLSRMRAIFGECVNKLLGSLDSCCEDPWHAFMAVRQDPRLLSLLRDRSEETA